MDASQFQVLIDEYEGLVSQLTHELQKVKSEHEELKTKIPAVVKENQKLIEELKDYVTLKKSRETQTENELIDNLRRQINLVLIEKEQVTQLWRKATKSVEILENELNIYKSGSVELFPKQEYERTKQIYEEKIKTLENKSKVIYNQLEVKNLEIKNLVEHSANNIQAVQNSEVKINALSHKISDLENTNENIKKKYRDKEKAVQKLMDQNQEFKTKMVEAIEVVHAALNEKDAALLREAKLRSDMQRMNEDVDNIIKSVKENYTKEIASIKEEAEKKYRDLSHAHKTLQEEMKTKLVEAEKQLTNNIILQHEIDKIDRRGLGCGCGDADESRTSKLLILEKNLESTFQKLLVSEKQNIQFKADLEAIKNDMEQMGAFYERSLKAKDVEKLSLQHVINQLQSAVNEKDLMLLTTNTEIERQRTQFINLERDYKSYMENQAKIINDLKNEKSELTISFTQEIKELGAEIESKDRISKKVIEETKGIVSKLENLTKTLKTDIHRLRKENKILRDDLDCHRRKLLHYQEVLNILSGDVNKINTTYRYNLHQEPNILS